MAEFPVFLHTGATQSVLVKKTDTPKELILQLYDDFTEEERSAMKVFEVKRGADGVTMERLLPLKTVLADLKPEWDQQKSMVCSLVVQWTKEFIIVNFNVYFRMVAGVSLNLLKVYISSMTTVADVVMEVKEHLGVKHAEQRFGLMGNYGGGKDMRKLAMDEKIQNLKNAWETPENTFFQFQVLPDKEDQKRLGATKESYLEIGGFVPMWKRRWFSLRGTSLFYFKEKGDSEELGEFRDINKCTVTAIGSGKKKGISQKFAFRFDIETEGNKTIPLAAEDEQSMNSWVEAMKSSGSLHPARSADVSVQQAKVKRTFVPIGTAEAYKAGKNLDPKRAGEAERDMEEIDKALDSVKEICGSLPSDRGEKITASMKELLRCVQSLVQKVGSIVERDDTPMKKKEKIHENSTNCKNQLKVIIPLVKQVAVLKPQVEGDGLYMLNEIPQPVQQLKKKLEELIIMCEMLVLAFMSDPDDELLIDNPWQQEPVIAPPMSLQTGNAQLDNVVAGFTTFGLTPELAEMMKQAASMTDVPDFEPPPAEVPEMRRPGMATSTTSTPSQQGSSADDDLGDILANLNAALQGI